MKTTIAIIAILMLAGCSTEKSKEKALRRLAADAKVEGYHYKVENLSSSYCVSTWTIDKNGREQNYHFSCDIFLNWAVDEAVKASRPLAQSDPEAK